MLNIDVNNPREVYLTGVKVLSEALGPVGFASFMRQCGMTGGDYTKEKYEKPEMTWEEIKEGLQKIKAQQEELPKITNF